MVLTPCTPVLEGGMFENTSAIGVANFTGLKVHYGPPGTYEFSFTAGDGSSHTTCSGGGGLQLLVLLCPCARPAAGVYATSNTHVESNVSAMNIARAAILLEEMFVELGVPFPKQPSVYVLDALGALVGCLCKWSAHNALHKSHAGHGTVSHVVRTTAAEQNRYCVCVADAELLPPLADNARGHDPPRARAGGRLTPTAASVPLTFVSVAPTDPSPKPSFPTS